ncbi:ABC transporter permease/substrate binding protein [Actinoallomurus purpureus]|uniref:ABC transporter permease/substrate binding protein n=1 Tax=Actinoallomurus purpureus TaxID=478114 RepID=UPI002092FCEC|nr:ABC transporter permease/substrate binding protein [Actinoallomurus purpureus]MCO6010161.1 ABC transporter permease/substrate binding protein [Actinoallomurus purpureus]
MPRIPLGGWVTDAVNFLTKHGRPVFSAISDVVGGVVHGLGHVLTAPPSLAFAALVAMLCWWLRGLLAGVLAFVGLMLIDALGQWNAAMETLALVLVASGAALIVGIPLGILSARVPKFGAVARPVLDFMQTMPAFVYLIPAISFFGLGEVPGVIATMIFSIPPGVRLTELGIKQVDREMVEAAEAFGAPSSRILTRVQLPLALPTIMTGVNQVIMLSLSMVVIAGMVGAEGLGANVFGAITQYNLGAGAESGLAVVLLAIVLDRMTSALGQRLAPAARRHAERAVHGGVSSVLRYRPRPALALSGVVVFALLAATLGVVGSGGGSKGKPITIGYIPWDEDIAVTQLWKAQLEKKGYQVTLKQVDAGPLFAGLGQGDIDLFFDAWLPATHADYYNRYKNKITDIGTWYQNASMQLAVLKDDPASSVADLKGQSARYKGRVVGIEPGAGEMKIVKNKVLPGYGLGDYKVLESSTAAMLAELNRSVQSKQPIVVTLWKPHWAYTKFPIKPLADPQNAFGSAEKVHTLGRQGFAKDFPQVNSWLKNFRMTDTDLFPLEDLVMNKYKDKPAQGVAEWEKQHPDIVKKLTG